MFGSVAEEWPGLLGFPISKLEECTGLSWGVEYDYWCLFYGKTEAWKVGKVLKSVVNYL